MLKVCFCLKTLTCVILEFSREIQQRMWREIVGASKSERAGGQVGDPRKSWAWRQNSSLVDLRFFSQKYGECFFKRKT